MGEKGSVFSLSRAKILSILHKKPMTISQLSKVTGLGRTTVYHHLSHLKKNKLIVEKKEKNEAGQPVLITTNKSNPMSLKIIETMENIIKLNK